MTCMRIRQLSTNVPCKQRNKSDDDIIQYKSNLDVNLKFSVEKRDDLFPA